MSDFATVHHNPDDNVGHNPVDFTAVTRLTQSSAATTIAVSVVAPFVATGVSFPLEMTAERIIFHNEAVGCGDDGCAPDFNAGQRAPRESMSSKRSSASRNHHRQSQTNASVVTTHPHHGRYSVKSCESSVTTVNSKLRRRSFRRHSSAFAPRNHPDSVGRRLGSTRGGADTLQMRGNDVLWPGLAGHIINNTPCCAMRLDEENIAIFGSRYQVPSEDCHADFSAVLAKRYPEGECVVMLANPGEAGVIVVNRERASKNELERMESLLNVYFFMEALRCSISGVYCDLAKVHFHIPDGQFEQQMSVDLMGGSNATLTLSWDVVAGRGLKVQFVVTAADKQMVVDEEEIVQTKDEAKALAETRAEQFSQMSAALGMVGESSDLSLKEFLSKSKHKDIKQFGKQMLCRTVVHDEVTNTSNRTPEEAIRHLLPSPRWTLFSLDALFPLQKEALNEMCER